MWVAVAFIGHGFYLTYYSRRYCGPSSGYLRVFGFILAGILIGYLVTSWLLLRIVAYASCEIIGVEGYEPTYFSLVFGILLEGAFLS